MSRAMLILDRPAVRQQAANWIERAPNGTRILFKAPRRTLEQNAKFWVLLTEIATQLPWHGEKLTTEEWKILFLDALDRERRVVPALEGTGFVSLGRSSSDLSKEEMSEMIELILAFGTKHGVEFHEPGPIL